MKKISVFDTSISNFNLGNEIIMESIYTHLRYIFPDDFFFRLPAMEITKHTIKYLQSSDISFFGGTNALNASMGRYRQWGLSLVNSFAIRNVVLMGIGWWKYEDQKTSLYTRLILKNVLSKKYLHAVRDSYTKTRLNKIGINNVINTGCPTLWNLTKDHCSDIPKRKSTKVILTLTDYKMGKERDSKILETLRDCYDEIYIWIQGKGDFDYIQEIKKNISVNIIGPNLEYYDKILETKDIDYVGTRLHAGIRALQKKRRSIIIALDNRATEMGKDFGLPIIAKKDLENLGQMINSEFATNITLPADEIKKWKEQFLQ